MDHEQAVRELGTERYLLGELTGDARNAFEAHLFECPRCAADLKAGVAMAEAMRAELAAQPAQPACAPGVLDRVQGWLSPVWLVPALAACLLLVVYQNVLEVPRLRTELAQANSVEVLNSLALAGGTARGEGLPRIVVARGKSFLLSVDIPPGAAAGSYDCTLYSPAGRAAWSVSVTPQQARDAVPLRIPAALMEPGEQTLIVRGPGQQIVATMKFQLEIHG